MYPHLSLHPWRCLSWLQRFLLAVLIGLGASVQAEAPVMTGLVASGAPAISGNLVAYPRARLYHFPGGGATIYHTLSLYSLSTGQVVETDKPIAQPDIRFSQQPIGPAVSGSKVAYIAGTLPPGGVQQLGRLRVYDASNGQDIDTGQDLYLGTPSGWSTRLVAISGDVVAYVTQNQTLGYYRISTGVATSTNVEAHGNPSISGNLIAYLNGNGCTIRYYNIATGIDTNIGHFNICDEAPAISGSIVAFTSGLNNPNTIVYHNIATGQTVDTGTNGSWRSVDGDVVAFMGENVLRYHLMAKGLSVDTGSPLYDHQPDISDGVIVFGALGGGDAHNNYQVAYLRVETPDRTLPTIDVTTPAAGGTYVLNQSVLAAFSCTDADSGIAACSGTVPNGQPIDTATAGTKTFTVDATDGVGNASSMTITYTVVKKPTAETATADVGVSMTDDSTKNTTTGSTVTYTLKVSNSGPAPADAVVLSHTIPSGLSILSADPIASAITKIVGGPRLDFNIGTLPAGSSATVVVQCRVTAAGGSTITSSAEVTSATYDPKSTNNVSSTIVKVKR